MHTDSIPHNKVTHFYSVPGNGTFLLPCKLTMDGGTCSLLLNTAVTEDTANLPDNLSALQEIKKKKKKNYLEAT